MQGVVKAFDPGTGTGLILRDLEGSIFRMLRPGQRVVFDVNDEGLATRLRLGSESDMGTPGY
jgi:cold shock CspA family protein